MNPVDHIVRREDVRARARERKRGGGGGGGGDDGGDSDRGTGRSGRWGAAFI